jgi:hypothetical protein
MKNNAKKYENDIIEVIKKNNLFVITDIFAFYSGCSRATFYNHGLDKLDSIKEAIDNNKIKTKQSLKNKWYKSENPTLQIALFKTICSDEEAARLNGSNQRIEMKTEPNLTNSQFKELAKEILKSDEF